MRRTVCKLVGTDEGTVSGLFQTCYACHLTDAGNGLGRVDPMPENTSEDPRSEPRPSGQPIIPGTASWLHRIGALLVDWIACYGFAAFVLRDIQHPAFGAVVMGAFLLESAVGVALSGGSFGQLATRIRVYRIDGTPLTLGSALVRQVLVCLLIPPLVFREDGRGLHDLLTKSAAFPLNRPAPNA